MRYKDGKGDPRGFEIFLDKESLPRAIIPRYRGNRLHILFHIAGVLICHYSKFVTYLSQGTAQGGLRKALCADLTTITAQVELQVLGLLGKVLTGPWMKRFYVSAAEQMNHIEGIQVVKNVLNVLKEKKICPLELLTTTTDLFGDKLNEEDVLEKLREKPRDEGLFAVMIKGCLEEIIAVIEKQYEKHFKIDVGARLQAEARSARLHNIDAEEIIGMFSAMKANAPNATLCYLSCRIRARKNRTVDYLDGLGKERRDAVVMKAIQLGKTQRMKRRLSQKDVTEELIRREEQKRQARDMTERRRVERKLKATTVEKIADEFPEVEGQKLDKLIELFSGEAVGSMICHDWYDEEEKKIITENGKIGELFESRGVRKYVVGYWGREQNYDDAEDYNVDVVSLCADFIAGGLVM